MHYAVACLLLTLCSVPARGQTTPTPLVRPLVWETRRIQQGNQSRTGVASVQRSAIIGAVVGGAVGLVAGTLVKGCTDIPTECVNAASRAHMVAYLGVEGAVLGAGVGALVGVVRDRVHVSRGASDPQAVRPQVGSQMGRSHLLARRGVRTPYMDLPEHAAMSNWSP
jgi:hypothetical protein